VHFSKTVGRTSLPWSSSSQISMLHWRMGNPSTGDGPGLSIHVSLDMAATRGHSKRTRWRATNIHGTLVGDELDPSLDIGHLVG
jgi:hypothetical protein